MGDDDHQHRHALERRWQSGRVVDRRRGHSEVIADEGAPSVELAIDFAGVDCEECVLPPDRLEITATTVISRNVGPRWL